MGGYETQLMSSHVTGYFTFLLFLSLTQIFVYNIKCSKKQEGIINVTRDILNIEEDINSSIEFH